MPTTTILRTDEEIFEIDARPSEKGRIVVEEQSKANDLSIFLGKENLGKGMCSEKVLLEALFVEHDAVGQLFVCREGTDHLNDQVDIGNGRGSDHEY